MSEVDIVLNRIEGQVETDLTSKTDLWRIHVVRQDDLGFMDIWLEEEERVIVDRRVYDIVMEIPI